MRNRHSSRTATDIRYDFWLVFDSQGAVALRRQRPDVARNERAVSCSATLPLSLFSQPELSFTMNVPADKVVPNKIDLETLAQDIARSIGVSFDIRVNHLDEGSEK